MAIVSFKQDPEEPFGTGEFRNEKGQSIYTSDPVEARRFVDTLPGSKSIKEQVTQESSNIAQNTVSVPNRPDLRTAENTPGYGQFNDPDVQRLNKSVNGYNIAPNQSSVSDVPNRTPVSAPSASPTPPSAPAPTGNKRVDAVLQRAQPYLPGQRQPGVIDQSGYSISNSSSVQRGRPKAAVENQITNESETIEGAKADNLRLAQEQDERVARGYDTQLSGLDTQKNLSNIKAASTAADIKANADRIWQLSNEVDPPVNPERYINKMSTGAKVGAVLGAALFGALGSFDGKVRENGFVKAFQGAVDQDIELQQDEIRRGAAKRTNRIAHYQALGADLRTAKALAERDAFEAGRRYIEVQAEKNANDGKFQAAARQANNALSVQQAQREGELWAQTEDRASYSGGRTDTYMDPALKATTVTPGQAIDTEYKRRELADANDVSEVVGRPLSAGQVKEIRQDAEKIGKEDKDLALATQLYINYANALGATVDPKTMDIIWPKKGDLKGTGPVDRATAIIPGTEDAAAVDAKKAFVEGVTSMVTGAAATLKQDKTFTGMAGGVGISEDQTKRNLQDFGRVIQRHRDAIRSGNPDAAKYYDHVNRGATEDNTPQPDK